MIKGFFFDLDGTLVDTHQSNYEAYKKALADFGVLIDFSTFKNTIGMQSRDFLPVLAPELSEGQYSQVALKKAEYYQELAHISEANQSLIGFMDQMKRSGHQIVLVTTAKARNAEVILRHHGLEDFFDFKVAYEDVVTSKPSPEGYLQALDRSGLSSNEVIAFEDSKSGMQAAEAAGIQVVMIREFQV